MTLMTCLTVHKTAEDLKAEKDGFKLLYEGWEGSFKDCSAMCITCCEFQEAATIITPSQARPLPATGSESN